MRSRKTPIALFKILNVGRVLFSVFMGKLEPNPHAHLMNKSINHPYLAEESRPRHYFQGCLFQSSYFHWLGYGQKERVLKYFVQNYMDYDSSDRQISLTTARMKVHI